MVQRDVSSMLIVEENDFVMKKVIVKGNIFAKLQNLVLLMKNIILLGQVDVQRIMSVEDIEFVDQINAKEVLIVIR